MDIDAAVAAHVEQFNNAVRSGDYAAFVGMFGDDAVMSFDGVPVGPFRGRAEILRAYQDQPPTSTLTVRSVDEVPPAWRGSRSTGTRAGPAPCSSASPATRSRSCGSRSTTGPAAPRVRRSRPRWTDDANLATMKMLRAVAGTAVVTLLIAAVRSRTGKRRRRRVHLRLRDDDGHQSRRLDARRRDHRLRLRVEPAGTASSATSRCVFHYNDTHNRVYRISDITVTRDGRIRRQFAKSTPGQLLRNQDRRRRHAPSPACTSTSSNTR